MLTNPASESRQLIELQQDLFIGRLFSNRVPLCVPIYQRAYAWETDEIADFVKDMRALYNLSISDPHIQPSHYFGGIVSIHYHEASEIGHKYEIVDGQQRLSTFMITFSLLAKAFETISEEAKAVNKLEIAEQALKEADEINNNLIRYGIDKQRQQFRLTLSRADKFYFEDLILGNNPSPTRESHKRLGLAQQTIQKELIKPIACDMSIALDDKLKNAIQLKRCISNECYVVHIIFNDKDRAYQLFSIELKKKIF